jgi:hypothetical protein
MNCFPKLYCTGDKFITKPRTEGFTRPDGDGRRGRTSKLIQFGRLKSSGLTLAVLEYAGQMSRRL